MFFVETEYVKRYASKEAMEMHTIAEEQESSGVSSVEIYSDEEAFGMEL